MSDKNIAGELSSEVSGGNKENTIGECPHQADCISPFDSFYCLYPYEECFLFALVHENSRARALNNLLNNLYEQNA